MPFDAILVEVHRPIAAAVERARPLLTDDRPFVVPIVDGADVREGIDAIEAFSDASGQTASSADAAKSSPSQGSRWERSAHQTSGRVVRLALALEEAGVRAEVSLDIHAALS